MNDADTGTDAPEDPARFARRIQAEIEAAAEIRRRQDPELRRREREIERTWASLAPAGATGTEQELLLDRAERLALIDVDAPLGERAGVRQVKSGIRKATYWYLRYVSDQLNALHNVMTRLLRNLDDRVNRLEAAASLDPLARGWVDDPSPMGEGAVVAVAAALDGVDDVVVAWCGSGELVEAIGGRAPRCYGVDPGPESVADGVHRGLDLRVAEPLDHLAAVGDAEIGGLVLTGAVARLALVDLVALVDQAARAVRRGGTVVVAAPDPSERDPVDAELLRGRGVGPATWARLLTAAGFSARVDEVADDVVGHVVVATRS